MYQENLVILVILMIIVILVILVLLVIRVILVILVILIIRGHWEFHNHFFESSYTHINRKLARSGDSSDTIESV